MYSASKRCTEILFDALRHELAPFGVTSTTVVAGPVKSVIHSHGDSWQMPENSKYADIRETIERRGGGEDGAWRMDTMKFAEGVVDKLLRGKNIKIWAGASVGLINFLANWLPDSWQVCEGGSGGLIL
jgi:1-acylglycerone phosphate reductase